MECVGFFPFTLNNSDSNYVELVQSPQVKASVPQDCPPASDASHKSQVVTYT